MRDHDNTVQHSYANRTVVDTQVVPLYKILAYLDVIAYIILPPL